MAADQNCVHRNWDDVCSMEKDWADDLWLKVEKTEKKKKTPHMNRRAR
jgi:hypothetical protein